MDHYSSSSLSRIYNGNESAGPLSRVPPNSRLYPFCFINCFRSIQYSILPRVLHNVPSTCDIADLTSTIKLSERWARAFSCRAIIICTSKGPLCYFAIADFSCQPKTYNQAKYRGWIRWFYLPLAPHISPYLRIAQIRGVFLSCFLLLGYFWGCILATRYQRESAKKKRVSISAKLCPQYSLDRSRLDISSHFQIILSRFFSIIKYYSKRSS